MELSEMQKKGLDIARGLSKLPRQEKLDIIASTFGCKTASLGTSPCTGKWRGSSDIYLTFDGRVSMGIANYRTPQAKTAMVQNECIHNTLARYNPEIVRELKAAATPALLKREAQDNEVAMRRGLKPYTFLNVELCDAFREEASNYLGWYCVTLAIDRKIIGFIETGLCHDIERGTVSEHNSRKEYFTAGGLRDESVDFIFNNVGFSSTIRMYQMPISAGALERAERTLSERRGVQPGQVRKPCTAITAV